MDIDIKSRKLYIMNNQKNNTTRLWHLIIAVILVILTCSTAVAMDFKAEFVKEVISYDEYVPCGNVFKPGDTIRLYVGVENVNRNRAAAVDFVAIIKDPNGYVVAGKDIKKRIIGYEDKIYDVFEFKVERNWLDGKYTLEVYAFDVLNDSAMLKRYNQLPERILYSGKFDIKVATISRKDAPYEKITLFFYVNSKLNETNETVNETVKIQPKPQFVYSLYVDKFIVEVGKPVEIRWKVRNEGSYGNGTIRILVNGEPVFEKEVELDTGKEEEGSFKYVPKKEGSYRVEIDGTNLAKIFFAKLPKERQVNPTPEKPERRGGFVAGFVVGSAVLLAVLVVIRILLR